MNTSNTIKKAKIGQILDATNNTLHVLLLNQFIPDINNIKCEKKKKNKMRDRYMFLVILTSSPFPRD